MITLNVCPICSRMDMGTTLMLFGTKESVYVTICKPCMDVIVKGVKEAKGLSSDPNFRSKTVELEAGDPKLMAFASGEDIFDEQHTGDTP